jgi:hypothetical protein
MAFVSRWGVSSAARDITKASRATIATSAATITGMATDSDMVLLSVVDLHDRVSETNLNSASAEA